MINKKRKVYFTVLKKIDKKNWQKKIIIKEIDKKIIFLNKKKKRLVWDRNKI
jgi:hypothetical protein